MEDKNAFRVFVLRHSAQNTSHLPSHKNLFMAKIFMGFQYESCQITDSRMYLKVVNTRLQAEVVPGDLVQAGIIVSNSEVGQGSVCVQSLMSTPN